MGRIEELKRKADRYPLIQIYGKKTIKKVLSDYKKGMNIEEIIIINRLRESDLKQIIQVYLSKEEIDKIEKLKEEKKAKIDMLGTKLPRSDDKSNLTLEEAISLVEGKQNNKNRNGEDENEL